MASENGKLGTFAGVFTPSILTILGIILFLRLDYVVGSVGLCRALLIIGLANLISVTTALSVSAIATNLRVKAGGDYYLISRTLGPAFGGAIGVVLFLAQSVSVGFYAMGFAEAFAAYLPGDARWETQAVAAGGVAALFLLAWLGADWATRFQYVVMALIAAALGSMLWGGIDRWSPDTLIGNLPAPAMAEPFWPVFAVFFPAVTGFTQGVSMSGDLADPARSIPRGTLAAVGLSIVVYVGAAVLLAASLPAFDLANDEDAMRRMAALGPLVDAGVVAATLSSALASFLGGPRILQALAGDRVFPGLSFFAAGHGPANNPRRAVILTAAIALGAIALGSLNLVAAIVAMFFLISYGLLNYATYFEAGTESPAFRPTFRLYHRHLGLAGALLCLGAMLAIDLVAGLVALGVVIAIYELLRLRADPARWADSHRAYHLHQIRDHLLAAAAAPEHPRDWLPRFLVFSDDTHRRGRLLGFVSWVEGGAGLTTVVRVLEGSGPAALDRRAEAAKALAEELEANDATAFPLVVSVSELETGIPVIVQAAGLGPLRVNTVAANWITGEAGPTTSLPSTRFGENFLTAFRLGCNLLILDAEADEWAALERREAGSRRIDVWWTEGHSGRLMLLFAYLMTRSRTWRDARVRLLAEAAPDVPAEEAAEALRAMLAEARIDAEPVVADAPGLAPLVALSGDASIVFVPFRIRGGRFHHPSGTPVAELLPDLPVTVLALAAQDIDLTAEPEEGVAAEDAALRDRVRRASKREQRLERALSRAERDAAADSPTGEAQGTVARLRRRLDRAVRFRRLAEAKAADGAGSAPPEGEDDARGAS